MTTGRRSFPLIDERKQLRSFGFLFGVILALIVPAIIWYRHAAIGTGAMVSIALGLASAGMGQFRPSWLAEPFARWMALARILNRIMTGILLTVVFFVIVTPTGLIRQWIGGPVPHSFRRFRDAQVRTYWQERERTPTDPGRYTKPY